jgi:hypothetical protein
MRTVRPLAASAGKPPVTGLVCLIGQHAAGLVARGLKVLLPGPARFETGR